MSQADNASEASSPRAAPSGRPCSRAKRSREHRALPSWAIDLIRDGVPRQELRERGQRAVWDALGRTALAAINAGHTRAEWEYEVVRPNSALGQQNRVLANSKERTPQAANKSLNSAWNRAEERAATQPPWTRETARAEARRRAEAARAVAGDADLPMPAAQRILLAHAAEKATRLGSVSVNLPRAATARETGLGEKAVRLHLARLAEDGLLALSERGKARTKTRNGRANVYRLPDEVGLRLALTSLSRETRQVGPERQTGGPPEQSKTGPRVPSRAYQSKPSADTGAIPGESSTGLTVGDVRALLAKVLDDAGARLSRAALTPERDE